MTTEEYWQQYIDRDVFENFELTCAFFSKELPEDFLEDYDVGEVILETTGHHIDDKKYPQAFKFIEILQDKQPRLYQEFFQYMDDFLVDYNCFKGDKEAVTRAFQNFLNYPLHQFDQFLQAFKTLRFYQYVELAEKAVNQSYEKVRDSEDLVADAGQYLAICRFYFDLEKEYNQHKGAINVDTLLSVTSEYDFNFDFSFMNSIAKGLQISSLDIKELKDLYENNYEEALFLVEGNYLQFMSRKGFSFVLSGFFWDELLKYWFRKDATPRRLDSCFEIDGSPFEEFIAGYHNWLFEDNKHEMAAVLWGSVYVYEFLFQAGLITKEVFDNFCSIAGWLKGKIIGIFISDLWRFDFIHTWERPDCISAMEFEAEHSIFRKSFSFPAVGLEEVKGDIIDELSKLGDLGTHIPEGVEEGLNPLEDLENDEEFMQGFLSATEPIHVEKKPGRNDPCTCGSGKKYKKCCGK